MSGLDIILLIAVIAVIGGAVALAIRSKKKGRSCGCGCGQCGQDCSVRKETAQESGEPASKN